MLVAVIYRQLHHRAFPVAAVRVWNEIPRHVMSAQSLRVSGSRLKTHLFRRSLPDFL